MSKRLNDIILAVVLLLVAVAGFLLYKFISPTGEYAVVIIDGQESERFSLLTDTEFEIVTSDGVNLLVIEDGKARIESADCPDKICAEHAAVSKVGETIVCLPHGVVVRIESQKNGDSEIDMVA